MHADITSNGYEAKRGTFTQFYGSDGLDASLLLLPRVGFVMRYDPTTDGGVDGLPGTEGTFLACSFWYADWGEGPRGGSVREVAGPS